MLYIHLLSPGNGFQRRSVLSFCVHVFTGRGLAAISHNLILFSLSSQGSLLIEGKVNLLYDWQFTTNQFVLASSCLRLTTRDFFFQLNPCSPSPYVTSSLTRRRGCLLCRCLPHSMLWKILSFALYTSPLSVQALQSRSCKS
jgi:hypothetical protein